MHRIRFVPLAVLFGALAAPAAAQNQLDFLEGLEEHRNLRGALRTYLQARAEETLAARARTVDSLSTEAAVAERRAYIRRRMIEAVGGLPERTPLNARVVGKLERPGYTIEKVIFESQPNFFVTANLYLPKAGRPPYPAVLYPLGHERGGKSHETWQIMLGSLAAKGYVALAWDPLGQGERAQMYDEDFEERKLVRSTTEHTVLGIQCLLTGDNLARYTIWDGLRALDYLLSRPEVDVQRVACTGNSGGGTHTAYLSALDDRIRVAAPSCYITSWSHLLRTIGPQDAEQVLLPWLAAGLDHGDFVLAFAPKPYLMLSAIRDFFSISGARATFQQTKALYERLGAGGKLSMSEVDQGHGYHQLNRLAAYDWFARWLKGQEDRAPEPEIEIAQFEDLACTSTGQVANSLGGETVYNLNRKRAAALNPGLPGIAGAGDLDGFRRQIRGRIHQWSGIDYQPAAVEVRPYGRIAREGYHIDKLVYESEPGILIPALLFVPGAGPARKPAIVYVDGEGKSAQAAPGGDLEWFVRQGHVVLAIDARGAGETRRQSEEYGSDWPRYFGDYESAMTALLLGETLAGMRAADVLRGVDLLGRRPEVEPERIYAVGRGAGAIPALFAAALDERIGRVAIEDGLATYRSVVEHRIHRGIFENVIPGILKAFDLPDVVASLAPRPALVVNPRNPLGHRLWPAAADGAYERPRAAYRAADAGESFRVARRGLEQGPEAVYATWLR